MNILDFPEEEELKQITSDDKNWGIVAHISTFTMFIIPLGNIIFAFLVFHFKGKQSKFVRINAINSLNFQISFLIYFVLFGFFCGLFLTLNLFKTFVFCCIILGILFMSQFVLAFIGLYNASQGRVFEYPITFKFIKD